MHTLCRGCKPLIMLRKDLKVIFAWGQFPTLIGVITFRISPLNERVDREVGLFFWMRYCIVFIFRPSPVKSGGI